MKRGEQKSRHLDSAFGVMRPLVHMLQIMQRKEVTKYSAKPVGTERRMQSTFTKRWVEAICPLVVVSITFSISSAQASSQDGKVSLKGQR